MFTARCGAGAHPPTVIAPCFNHPLRIFLLQAGTGTWNGPAPTGARNPEAAAAAKPAVVYEATTALLSTGQRMPMIGLGTYQLSSADVVRKALELGYRHFDCELTKS
jgi:hypothetical protein